MFLVSADKLFNRPRRGAATLKARSPRHKHVVDRGRAECDMSLKCGYRLYHVVDVRIRSSSDEPVNVGKVLTQYYIQNT